MGNTNPKWGFWCRSLGRALLAPRLNALTSLMNNLRGKKPIFTAKSINHSILNKKSTTCSNTKGPPQSATTSLLSTWLSTDASRTGKRPTVTTKTNLSVGTHNKKRHPLSKENPICPFCAINWTCSTKSPAIKTKSSTWTWSPKIPLSLLKILFDFFLILLFCCINIIYYCL